MRSKTTTKRGLTRFWATALASLENRLFFIVLSACSCEALYPFTCRQGVERVLELEPDAFTITTLRDEGMVCRNYLYTASHQVGCQAHSAPKREALFHERAVHLKHAEDIEKSEKLSSQRSPVR